METIIFFFALFTVSLGNAVPHHPNEDLIAKAIKPQHPNADLIHQVEQLNINGRIIGGMDVEDIAEFPWQASLQRSGSHICGAVIISDTWLVTAAHCVDDRFPRNYKIKVGNVEFREGEEFQVVEIVKHSGYGTGTGSFPNDIAVVRVSDTMPKGNTIKKVTLAAEESNDFAGVENCWITGWGVTTTGGGSVSETLKKAGVDVFSNNKCKNTWGSSINDGHVCIGKTFISGACNGDSGGPLTCNIAGNAVLVGVTSWGMNGCSTEYPSVYTRISYFRKWIDDNTSI